MLVKKTLDRMISTALIPNSDKSILSYQCECYAQAKLFKHLLSWYGKNLIIY